MVDIKTAPYAALVLRLTIAGLFAFCLEHHAGDTGTSRRRSPRGQSPGPSVGTSVQRSRCIRNPYPPLGEFLLLALNGPPTMSELCPLLGVHRTSHFETVTAAFNPKRTSAPAARAPPGFPGP